MFWDADMHAGRNVMRRVEVVKVDDKGEIQKITVKGLADEEYELPLRGQPHGLTTIPPVGSVGYLFIANGRPDQAFLMGLEHPDIRPKDRKDGESEMYAKKKQSMLMDEKGNTIIRTPEGVYHNNP
jgi:phage gp45-like